MKRPIIELKDFSFQYRTQAKPTLNNINLTIYEGEKVLIVGPSGSGKSTLSNCINGLVPFSYEFFFSLQFKIHCAPRIFIFLSLTVVEIKNRYNHCIYWFVAIFFFVTKFSIFLSSFTFFLW